ncbi:MAG: hypothetical protein CMJ83_09540 [Planctomycetes bacterium]|nr:hypothetical protein [Planctomycetota bacterium]
MTNVTGEPLRAGLSGCGGISHATLEAAARSPDFSVVALHDADAGATRRLGARFGVAGCADSFDGLLGDDIDFLILNGPNHVHAEQAIAAVSAGKPVLVQKPMARDHAEACTMADAARRADVPLGVTMLELGRPLHQDLCTLIRDGFIGEPVLVEACLAHANHVRSPPAPGDWRLDPAKVGGGVFIQLAVHHLALASWLLDRPVVEVGALSAGGHTPFEEESTVALARFDGGAVATFSASWATDAVRFSVSGTEGRIEVADDRVRISVNRPFSGTVVGAIDAGDGNVTSMDDIVARGRPRASVLEVHGRFARAVRGEDAYPWPASRALADMRVLDAAATSMRTGRIEAVGEEPHESADGR